MSTTYGYARVSTKLQATDGNSLETQETQLRNAGADKIYADVFTGVKTDRPELDRLLAELVPGDTLIVTKLDRIARSLEEGLKLIQDLRGQDIAIHVLNMGLINDTPTGDLIVHIMLAFAEFERKLIIERTQEGRAIARLKPGYRDGRKKKYSQRQMDHAMELLKTYSYRQVESLTGISKSTLIRYKKERGIDA
jgi:DNA invertase Pin-like site-specific DNA recombinase